MLGRWIREEKVSILLGISFAVFTAVMLYASCHMLEIYAKERDENRYLAQVYRVNESRIQENRIEENVIQENVIQENVIQGEPMVEIYWTQESVEGTQQQEISTQVEEITVSDIVGEYEEGMDVSLETYQENAYEPESKVSIVSNNEYAVDMVAMHEQYPDACGWITIPDTPIDYVVAHSEDNEKYLERTIKGDASQSGTLFLDYRNVSSFQDEVSIIYGHNMYDGSMFGTLKKYVDQTYACAHNRLILQTPQAYLEYELLAVGQIKDCDEYIYSIPAVYAMDEVLDHINAVQYVDLNEKPKVILSTCIKGENRRVVIFQQK